MKKRSPVSDSSDSELKSAQAQDPADDENETQPKRSDEFARLLEDSFRSTRKSLSTGDRVKSEILSIGREDVFVSTGTMHDGVIRKKELMGEAGQLKYQVGDSVELYVTQVRGSEIFLSMSAPVKSHSSRPRREPRGFQMPEEGRAEAPSRRNQFQEKRELSERSFWLPNVLGMWSQAKWLGSKNLVHL